MGVRSAIDDFGTGYCGLKYLSALPVASLKIDRSFINGMSAEGMSTNDEAIVTATIALGHSLGLSLVAEGVETEEQRDFLAAHGCELVQGYLFGKPMPAEDLVDRMWAEGPLQPEAVPVAAPAVLATSSPRS